VTEERIPADTGPATAADLLATSIRQYRKDASLSQGELAAKIGYSPQYVSLAERSSKGGLPSLLLVTAMDNALHANGALLALRRRADEEQVQARAKHSGAAFSTASPAGRAEQPVEVLAILAMSKSFQETDRQLGGGVLYDQVARYLEREIGPRLLDASAAGPNLFSAAASITEITGWMAHDSRDDDEARRRFDRAFRLATAAGNAALVGNVCASMSHLASQLGQSTAAVRIAEKGLIQGSSAQGTTRLAARLHAMKARGLAIDGDLSGCVHALDGAAEILAGVGDEQSPDWITFFDEAALAGESSSCLLRLGRFEDAEREARLVIQLRSDDRVRSRAFAQLTLARVLLAAGRIDEAAAVGTEICDVAPSLTSARVRTRLNNLGEAMKPHADAADVRVFLDKLAAARQKYQRPAKVEVTWPV
jgi:transcriptional regulator with XRE-family HTH domain